MSDLVKDIVPILRELARSARKHNYVQDEPYDLAADEIERLRRELGPTIERWEGQLRLSKRLMDERDAARAENSKLKEDNRSLRFQLRGIDLAAGGE